MTNKKTSTKLKDARTGMTRKKFLGTSLVGATAFTVVPAHVLGGRGKIPPSDKLNIAGIGIAGKGAGNLSNVERENIVALCDVDKKYAAPVFNKYPKAKVWTDFRKMLEEQKDIDAVIVATPDHLHAVITKTAMELGKHVYTEKPLTRTVEEARVLRETARKTGVATQMGNQGHSKDSLRELREWIEDGVIGDVNEVHCWTGSPGWPQAIGRPLTGNPVPSYLDWDLWLGPAPERPYHPIYHPNRWRGWWDFGNGKLGDIGCHIVDAPFYSLQLGAPHTIYGSYTPTLSGREGSYKLGSGFDVNLEINGEYFPVQTSCSGPDAETAPASCVIRYEFSARNEHPPVTLTWWDGGLVPPILQTLGHSIHGAGTLFIGDKGSIYYDRKQQQGGIFLLPESRKQAYNPPPKKYPRIEEENHDHDWIKACKGGRAACSNFDYAGPLTEIVLLGNVALRTDEKIEWDAENMKVTNAPEAERYIKANYRKGWEL